MVSDRKAEFESKQFLEESGSGWGLSASMCVYVRAGRGANAYLHGRRCASAHVQMIYVCVCAVSWNAIKCVLGRDRQWALTRQVLMQVFIRAWGEAERTGQ